jgi:recombination endonuclease VII
MTNATRLPFGISDDDLVKRCPACAQILPISRFSKNVDAADLLSSQCKGCVRWTKLKCLYGIGKADYESLLSAQSGRCAICCTPAEDVRLPFAVDHDHACCPGRRSCGACVRGLICDSCNRGVGYLGDDSRRLRAAADYLDRYARAS